MLTPRPIDVRHHWVETECVPAEPVVKAQLEKFGRWKIPPLIRQLREKAKKEGLFNLFLPKSFGDLSPGLTNLEYSCCAEIMVSFLPCNPSLRHNDAYERISETCVDYMVTLARGGCTGRQW